MKTPVTAEVNTRVGVGQRDSQFLAEDVFRVRAVGQDIGDVLVDERRLLEPPVDEQDEVTILPLAPESLVTLCLAFGIVIDDAVDDLRDFSAASGSAPDC